MRLRLSLALTLLLCGLALAACGDAARLEYAGEAGQATALRIDGWVPWIDARVNGGDPRSLLVDTGVPLTMLFGEAFPELAVGRQTVDLEAFQLRFPRLAPAVVRAEEGEPICAGEAPAGLLGCDLFGHFRLALDYRGQRAFLFDDAGQPPAPFVEDVAPAVTIPTQLLGGGTLLLEEAQQLITLPATRMIVEVSVEGATHTAMLDTGSSLTVISDELLAQLPQHDRPSFCCTTVALIDDTVTAPIARLGALRLDGAEITGLPAIVLDRDELFAALGAEVGRPLHLLIGGSFLRHFATELDYPRRTLRLQRYRDDSHVQRDEYVLPGFSFCQAATPGRGMVVLDVFEGTDAERKGVARGQLLVAVDGVDVRASGAQQVAAMLRAVGEGSETALGFEAADGGEPIVVSVLVERVLPDLP